MARYNFRDAALNAGRFQRSDSVTSAIGPLGSSALYFDGNNVNPVIGGFPAGINSSDALDISFPGDFTWEGYVQFDATAPLSGERWLFNHNSGWQVYRDATNSSLRLRVAGVARIAATTVIAAGTNYKWSVTRVSGVVTLRINGIAESVTYSNAAALNAGSSVWFGADGSAASRFKGFMDEVALYNTAKYTANYTPTFAEAPEPSADPLGANLLFLAHGDYSQATAASAISRPASMQAFAPTWPATVRSIAAPVPVYRYYWGGLGKIVGTTKIKGTPNTPVSRRVRLIREIDSVCVAERWSDPVTGYYEFLGFDPTILYTVIVYDGPRVFRAAVQDAVVPEIYTP